MILTACSNAQPQAEMPTVGGETDAHGCLPSAGQSYSYLKKACVQVFDVADIKLDDPANKTQAVYGILWRHIRLLPRLKSYFLANQTQTLQPVVYLPKECRKPLGFYWRGRLA